jgi:hypothetical protein
MDPHVLVTHMGVPLRNPHITAQKRSLVPAKDLKIRSCIHTILSVVYRHSHGPCPIAKVTQWAQSHGVINEWNDMHNGRIDIME